MSSREKAKAEARARREAQEAALAASERRKRRLWTIGAVFVLAVAIVVVAIVVSSSSNSDDGAPSSNVERQAAADAVNQRFGGIPQHGNVLGSPKAPLVLEEFGDLKCPFCKEFAVKALPTLVDKYVRPGKLQIVFEPVPQIPGSQPAHEYAFAAGQQNKMFQFLDMFYVNQKDERDDYVTPEFLKEIGSQVRGLDTAKAQADSSSKAITEMLQQSQQRANDLGVQGTPSFTLSSRGVKASSLLEVRSLDASAFTDPIDKALESQ